MSSREDQLGAAAWLCRIIVETVEETGEHGAPGGILYAALMNVGVSLELFEMIMGTLVEAGKLRKSGDLYFKA